MRHSSYVWFPWSKGPKRAYLVTGDEVLPISHAVAKRLIARGMASGN